ncbi:ABC transporter permease [Bifidobacterium panos]|uniref:Transport permease protein n=1 Tax=Bifidobacterium panos TaxID=2675321 RepID=A0ABX1T0I4_9BIFI|nr:polysaccharide ABC transporter permease [Bifidobacterium sp. DSM 109963]
MKALVKRIQERYHYAWVVLKGLVKTDFKLRYQGSMLGIAWSVLQPLMLFCVMYVVFAKFLRMSDGTPTYPVVLLMGISSWQFYNEATSIGLRSIVDRGDLLRKIHFPNYIVVASATIGSLISLGINFLVVFVFALFNHVHFTWRVLLLPLNFIELYILALGTALLLATMYVYFRDVSHIWDVLSQVLFYSIPVIYPLSMVIDNTSLGSWGPKIAKVQLMNPIAQTVQDIRHNFIAPETQPTIWTLTSNPFLRVIPLVLAAALLVLGVYVFRRNNRKFAEVM